MGRPPTVQRRVPRLLFVQGLITQSKVIAQLTLLVAITGPAPWQLSRCTAEDG